ncbi:MAG: DUF3450 domain-containing protein [Stenotrophobium sp.]
MLLSSGLAWSAGTADIVGQALNSTEAANTAARASQQRINQLDDQTRQMLERYRAETFQAQQLNVYAQQLEQLAAAQDTEKVSLQRQLTDVDQTDQQIVPLMLRMVASLQKFVTQDLPFLKQERQDRIAALQRLMTDPSVNVAEKYRRILEAYQVEADYGRTLGAERAQVDGKVVDVLRVGRTALFYLSTDGDSAGRWDASAGQWVPLSSGYIGSVRKGLRIAHEQTAADLLTLPMPTPAGAAP